MTDAERRLLLALRDVSARLAKVEAELKTVRAELAECPMVRLEPLPDDDVMTPREILERLNG